jgi:hypothetical protein
MSHFVVYAIVPTSVAPRDAKAFIDGLMAPYDEQIEVKPYKKTCWCVQRGAEARGDAMIATIETLRVSFGKEHEAKLGRRERLEWGNKPLTPSENKELDQLVSETDRLWKEHLAPREAVVDLALKNALKNPKSLADKSCDECKGTGKSTSTYNPKSKWDWYRIGGRWDGVIRNRPAESDERGGNHGAKHEQIQNNMIPLSEVGQTRGNQWIAEITDSWIPFAILGPDGSWHEKGKMGWWACVSNEKEDWPSQARALFERYREGHYAVALDCHI